MENLNKGRNVPGFGNFGNIARQKSRCPWGMNCNECMIALNVNGKLKCSISVIAAEVINTGLNIVEKGKK